jgi:hypothetical protein
VARAGIPLVSVPAPQAPAFSSTRLSERHRHRRRLALHGRVIATSATRLRSGHRPSTHLVSLALVLGLLDRVTHSRSRARFIEPRNAHRYKCKASRGYCYLPKQPRPAAALTCWACFIVAVMTCLGTVKTFVVGAVALPSNDMFAGASLVMLF